MNDTIQKKEIKRVILISADQATNEAEIALIYEEDNIEFVKTEIKYDDNKNAFFIKDNKRFLLKKLINSNITFIY